MEMALAAGGKEAAEVVACECVVLAETKDDAVLPPPEEVRQVETAIGASRAEQARDDMLKH